MTKKNKPTKRIEIPWSKYEILLINGVYHYRYNGVLLMTSTRDLTKEE